MLIERYLYQVSRYLPRKQRDDIIAELSSELQDMLDARVQGDNSPTNAAESQQAEVVALLKEMGSPQEVGARYHPAGQYLVGPAMFPLFRLVLSIVLAASLGGQLVARLVGVVFGGLEINPLETFWDLLNTIPPVIGMVVVTFFALQWFEIRPDHPETPFDPPSLPEIEGLDPVKRGELLLGIVFSVLFLVFISGYSQVGGWFGGSRVIVVENPVVDQNFSWILLSVLAGILVDVILIWRGHWQASTRLAKIAVNAFGLYVIYLLIAGHNAWLAENASAEVLRNLLVIPGGLDPTLQVAGMAIMPFILSIVALVVSIETIVFVGRLIRDLVMPQRLSAPLPENG